MTIASYMAGTTVNVYSADKTAWIATLNLKALPVDDRVKGFDP